MLLAIASPIFKRPTKDVPVVQETVPHSDIASIGFNSSRFALFYVSASAYVQT